MTEQDALLRRLERTGIAVCLVMAAIAAGVSSRHVASAAGVLAGGALAAVSYRGIKSGIDVLVRAASGGAGGGVRTAIGLVKFFTRYAILAAAAYLMLARWRLPPVAVFAGASSLVVGVTIEAARQLSRGRAAQSPE